MTTPAESSEPPRGPADPGPPPGGPDDDPLAAVLGAAHQSVERTLRAVREHLGMEVAFVGEFVGAERVVRHVDAAPGGPLVPVGAADLLEQAYCRRVAEGALAPVVADAAREPLLRDLPATRALGVRAFVGAPVTFPDGRLYGTLCCFGRAPDPTLTERDARLVRFLARLVGERLEEELARHREHLAASERVRAVLRAGGEPAVVFQPIVDLRTGRAEGVEALARFGAEPQRPPDRWFAEAHAVGLGVALEVRAVRAALAALGRVPEPLYVALNVGAEALCSAELAEALARAPARRVVLELTEHEAVGDPALAGAAAARFRARGFRLALDDAGAGYAGLSRILQVAPEVIKLDAALTRAVDVDPARRALASSLVAFARSVGAALVAEGVETAAELAALRGVGVVRAQGHHLGRPAAAPWVAATPRR